jgi:2-dehydro-3-deoxyphosphooctonate aldolase (KDO 8-P synthase)
MVVRIGGFEVGDSNPFCLFAGPCVIETEAITMATAEKLMTLCSRLSIPFVFKASYDKANRTSARSYRGPGLREGLRILLKVKETFRVPVVSDVHEPRDAAEAAGILDVLQVPAFLCRQTDLLVAAARTGRVVNVKKGQFLAPEDTVHLVDKVRAARAEGDPGVLITERGASFGYHNLVVDFRGLQVMSDFAPVVFDATHAVQQPGLGEVSGGRREFVPLLPCLRLRGVVSRGSPRTGQGALRRAEHDLTRCPANRA